MTDSLLLEAPDEHGVALLRFDRPGRPVNTLSLDLADEFRAVFDRVEADATVRAVVITSGKEGSFIAGADIDMLGQVTTAAEGARISHDGKELMDALAGVGKPVVAAVNGDCLGGGLELILACHGRVAADTKRTKFALPEVQLGLLPGMGGTQRLPPLIGLPAALDVMLTGKNLRPAKALKLGLLDAVVPPNQLLRAARDLARRLADGEARPTPHRNLQDQVTGALLDKTTPGRNLVFKKAREQVMKTTRGLYPAPLRILDLLQSGGGDDAESRGFGELLRSPESAALRHLFHCITTLKKDDGVGADVKPREVRRVGLLGGGLMGAGIASVLADKGVTVRIKDIEDDALVRALGYADAVFPKAVRKRHYGTEGASERLNRISGGLDFAGFGLAELVIEAVPEKIALKRAQVLEIERITRRDAIFASNTSALPISQIAEGAAHPERVIGMHFFSPVEKMPLVEVITTGHTSPEVTRTVAQVARRMGKHVIVVHDGPGFYTTRVLAPYLVEAMRLLGEGFDVADIDEAALSVGFPVGPVALMDEVGIDVGAKVTETMREHFGDRLDLPDDEATQAFLAEGRLGRKADKGFYVYKGGRSKQVRGRKVVDRDVYKHLPGSAERRAPDHQAMAERLLMSLLHEAIWALHDGVLRDPLSGDLGAVFGIGFPPMLGGPFFHADRLGTAELLRRLKALEREHGPRFAPCPLIAQMKDQGQRFHES